MLCALTGLMLECAGVADEWFLLPEPKFMGREVAFQINDAKETVLAPAKMGRFGVEFPTLSGWTTAGLGEDAVRDMTRKIATEWFKHVTPRLVRNRKKVVEYAVVQSNKLPTSVTIFAPEFRKHFEDVFGPRMIIVIPNRQTVFVFPGVGVDYTEYAPLILDAWRSSAPKASIEVFELSAEGIKAVGRFEEP